MSDVAARIAENLARVRGRIAEAARASGRSPESITLVAVTKYVGHDLAAALVAAGCADLAESRPQELWSKAAALSAGATVALSAGATGVSPVPVGTSIRWHLVGHLQRNKIRRTLPLVHLIHSVDSPRLLAALDAESIQLGQPARVLLEVNVSGDITKTGMKPTELESVLNAAGDWPHVSIRGLMGMASLVGGTDTARRDFACLAQIRERLAKNLAPGVSLAELSMGMSGDFEVAIAAGATIVRVGSALFEGVA